MGMYINREIPNQWVLVYFPSSKGSLEGLPIVNTRPHVDIYLQLYSLAFGLWLS